MGERSELRRLVACPDCGLQFDASGHPPPARFHCACGALVVVAVAEPHDSEVVRCSSCGAPRSEERPACDACGADFTLHEQDLHTLCPSCMSRISDRARFCHACGAGIVPQGTIGELTERPCPVCGELHALYGRNVEGEITVLECDRCAGVWVGHGIFRLLEERSDRDVDSWAAAKAATEGGASADGEPFYRPCVACGKLMHRRNYGRRSGVIVDVCHEHGLWFDRGELERILAWRREGGARRAETTARPATTAASAPTLEGRAFSAGPPAAAFIALLIDSLIEFFGLEL